MLFLSVLRVHDLKLLLKNDKVELTLLLVWETYADQDNLSVTVNSICFPSSTCSIIWLPSLYDLDNEFELVCPAIFYIVQFFRCI